MPVPTPQQIARLKFGEITKQISTAKDFRRRFKAVGNQKMAGEASAAVDMFTDRRNNIVKQMKG